MMMMILRRTDRYYCSDRWPRLAWSKIAEHTAWCEATIATWAVWHPSVSKVYQVKFKRTLDYKDSSMLSS